MSRRCSKLILVSLASILPSLSPAGTAVGHVDSLRALMQEERYAEVEERARAQLSELDAGSPAATTAHVELLNLIVEAALEQGRGEEPGLRADAERAVDLAVKLLGESEPRKTLALMNLADVVHRQDGASEALALADRALASAESAEPPDELLVARVLGKLGELHEFAGLYTEAAEFHERQLEIQERILGPDHVILASSLPRWAWTLHSLDQSERAIELLERALSISESAGPGMKVASAEILTLLGRVHLNLTRTKLAEKILTRAVQIAQEEVGTEHPIYAEAIRLRAAALRDMGRLDEAEDLLRRALAIQEQLPRHERLRAVLRTLVSLTVLVYHRGDLVEARRLKERQIEGTIALYGSRHPNVAAAQIMYGNILRELGLHEEAQRALRSGIEIEESSSDPSISTLCHLYLTLAVVLLDVGDTAEFQSLYDRWFPEMVKIYGEDSYKTQIGPFYEAIALVQERRREQARTLLDEVLVRNRETQVASSPYLNNTITLLAELELEVGDPARAEELFRTSLEQREESFGPGSVKVAVSLRGLSRALARLGRPHEALEAALRAERISYELRRLGAETFSEREALVYGSEALFYASDGYSPGVERGLDLLLSLVADEKVDDRNSLRLVMGELIRSRAVVLDELARRHRIVHLAADSATKALSEDLAEARTAFARLAVRSASTDAGPHFRARLAEARARKEAAERALAAQSAAFRDQQQLERTGLSDVAAALGPNEALITYARYVHETSDIDGAGDGGSPDPASRHVPSYIAWVVRDRGETIAAIPLGPEKPIAEALVSWHRALSEPPSPVKLAASQQERRYRSRAAALRRLVWDPVARTLKGTRHVFVVPDGPLHLVSLATLPTADGRYLLQSGPQIEYLTVERDLIRTPRPAPGRGLLALGGASFDAEPEATPGSAVEIARSSLAVPASGFSDRPVYRGPRSACARFGSMEFDPLVHSLEEVDEIASLWRQAESKQEGGDADAVVVLTDSLAHEGLFKSLAPGRRVLHVATHGFFVDSECASALGRKKDAWGMPVATRQGRRAGENPLYLSGLVLAGANNRQQATAGEDDGILTAEEIATLDLSAAEWVVLSGCRTGTGPTMVGEGVFGLRRAFKIAGAGALIMSLWPVEDRATSRWMSELYAARGDGLESAAAVRRASLRLLDERRDAGRSTHPVHWGAFVPIR